MTSRLLRASMIAIALSLVSTAAFAGAHQYKLRVDGLACPFCAYGIEKKFNATKGVKAIKIDINTGTVTVTMEAGAALSEAQARQIVKDSGFTLGGFQTVPGPAGKAGK
ncbi:MAG: heavy-metal-associated domain-containing protein [Alphaproteobacteria bacterium]